MYRYEEGEKMIRLKELRQKSNMSQAVFAKTFGVAQNTVSNWENGNRIIDSETAYQIADYFNVTVDYLLGRSPNLSLHDSGSKSIKIPVLGYVRAGIPVEAVEDILDYEEITPEMAAQGEHFALKIKGDSMSPRILENDIVIVRKQSDIDSGNIALVLVNGEDATVKKVIKKDTSLMLVSFNGAYEPIVFNRQEIESLPVEIVGKIVELRGKF